MKKDKSDACLMMAETVGFEPTEGLHPQRISSPLHSASLPRFQQIKIILRLAEAVRFELTEGYQPSTVFKTVALNHSATLPFLESAHNSVKRSVCQAFFSFYGRLSRKKTHSFSFEAASL